MCELGQNHMAKEDICPQGDLSTNVYLTVTALKLLLNIYAYAHIDKCYLVERNFFFTIDTIGCRNSQLLRILGVSDG